MRFGPPVPLCSSLLLTGAGPGNGGSAPLPPVAGPLIWLDATQETFADNDAVGQFTDWSGNGNHFISSGTMRSTYKTNIINGRPVFRFDGVDDSQVCVAAVSIRSFAIVARYNAPWMQSAFPGLLTGNNNANEAFYVGGSLGGSQFYFFPADITYYKNNVETDETANGAGPMNAFAIMFFISATARNYTWQIGRDRAQNPRRWLGDVAEVVGSTSAWTSTERGLLQSYFASKYAL